jgi:hypothetical protein
MSTIGHQVPFFESVDPVPSLDNSAKPTALVVSPDGADFADKFDSGFLRFFTQISDEPYGLT